MCKVAILVAVRGRGDLVQCWVPGKSTTSWVVGVAKVELIAAVERIFVRVVCG